MRAATYIFSAAIVTTILAHPRSQHGNAPFTIDRHTIDGGGGSSTGEDFLVSGTIGQLGATVTSLTGTDENGDPFEITGGFWTIPATATGDCNADQRVDLTDFTPFYVAAETSGPAACDSECMLPADPSPVSCCCVDFNRDGNIDLLDFWRFQRLVQNE